MNIFIETLLYSFIIQVFFFAIAATFKTDKVTDLSYGITFIFLACWVYFRNGNFYSYQTLVFLMVVVWGVRLAGYLFVRIMKIKKDERFDTIRKDILKLVRFWSFQAIAVWVIMLPSTYILSLDSPGNVSALMIFAVALFLVGLSIETIADLQKFRFKNNPENKDLWIESGLWRYSRHPNYFGEMLLWWSVFIYSVPFQSGISWLTITGPLFITFILLFVSGIPPLEKKYNQRYRSNPDYQNYKEKTSLLVPLPVNK